MGIKKLLFLIIVFFLVSLHLPAEPGGFGLGIYLGEPTGITAKLWLSAESALDLCAAWSFIDLHHITFHLFGDYLFHIHDLFTVPSGTPSFYCGIGGRIIILTGEVVIGIRIPVGIAYFLEKPPLEICMEIAPLMEVFPATMFTVSAGIGVRWFF
jgi:hypothetical protein